MRRLVVIPACCAAMVGALGAGAAGAGGDELPGEAVAKTTIPAAPAPTVPVPTVPVPTAPVPTVPVPSAMPTVPVPTVPAPTAPVVTVGVPTTEPSGLSPETLAAALPIFGLDAAKLACIDAALPSFGNTDDQAIAALQGCGVALMPLLRGMVAVLQAGSTFLEPTATTIALPPVVGIEALPTSDAWFLGFMLLIDPTQASCLATGLAGAASDDDSTALAIFDRCNVEFAFTIQMLMFALVGDLGPDPTGTSVPAITVAPVTIPAITVPAVSTPVGTGVPTTLSVAPDDPIVDQFQEMLLEEEGITLDDQQAACLLSQIGAAGEIDTTDMAAMVAILDACGITLSDLVPGGVQR